jgi:phosphomannomutase
MSDILTRARDWAGQDPDPETRAELLQLIERVQAGDSAADAELRDRFAAPLEFGTAGLRGRVEGGPARMNRLVVTQASYGLATCLIETAAETGIDVRTRGVVVGFDGRYSSRQFAEDTAAVLAGSGIPALLFPDPVPTPLCAFAVTHLAAAAGVMVTASHNPPRDNGYKVYRHDGAQIIPPQDKDIAARIAQAPRYDKIPRLTPPDAAARGLRRLLDDSVELAYLDGLAAGSWYVASTVPLRLVYTAMHGVGHRPAIRALRQAGFDGVAVVPSQADADGAFRTVPFPNPEEPGAMDRSLALAEEVGAELVLANDPDADRLAAAVPDPSGHGYRMLSGNEIGVLMADDALQHAPTDGRPKLVATSIVSSTLLSRMAQAYGARYAETLTGFKWIADAARRGAAAGEVFVFGYEEALGYTFGTLVGDKDGIGAALHLAALARQLKSEGRTLLQRLDEILVAHGMSREVPWSVTLAGTDGKQRIEAAMTALRTDPPTTIGGSAVVRVADLKSGEERSRDGRTQALTLPRSDVLTLYTEDGARLIVRPSGTEPKVKFYLELMARVTSPAEVDRAREELDKRGAAIKTEILTRLGLS